MKSHLSRIWKSCWPWCLPFALPFVDGLIWWSPTLRIIFVFAFPIALVGAVYRVYANAAGSNRRRIVPAMLVVCLVFSMPFAPSVLWKPFYLTGTWIGLLPFCGYYQAKIASLPPVQGPRTVAIDFGYVGPFGHILVYDEGDGRTLPTKLDTAGGLGSSDLGILGDHDIKLRHIVGNFYADDSEYEI